MKYVNNELEQIRSAVRNTQSSQKDNSKGEKVKNDNGYSESELLTKLGFANTASLPNHQASVERKSNWDGYGIFRK